MGCGNSKAVESVPPSKQSSKKYSRIPNAQWITPVSHTSITIPTEATEKLEIRHEAFSQELGRDNKLIQSSTIADFALTQDEVSDLLSGRSNPRGERSKETNEKQLYQKDTLPKLKHSGQVYGQETSVQAQPTSKLNSDNSTQGVVFSADAIIKEPVVQNLSKNKSRSSEINKNKQKVANYPPIIEAETYLIKSKDGTTHLVNKHLIRHPNCAHDISLGEIHVEVTHKTPINPEEYLRLRNKPALVTNKRAAQNLRQGCHPMWVDDVGTGQRSYAEIKVVPLKQESLELDKSKSKSKFCKRKERKRRHSMPKMSSCCRYRERTPKRKVHKCGCVVGDTVSEPARSPPLSNKATNECSRSCCYYPSSIDQDGRSYLEPINCGVSGSRWNECNPPQYAWHHNWPVRLEKGVQRIEHRLNPEEVKKEVSHNGKHMLLGGRDYHNDLPGDARKGELFDTSATGVMYSPRFTTEVSEHASDEPIEEWRCNMNLVKPSISTTSAEDARISHEPKKHVVPTNAGERRQELNPIARMQPSHPNLPNLSVISDRCHCTDGGLAAYLQQWQDHMALLNQSLWERNTEINDQMATSQMNSSFSPVKDAERNNQTSLQRQTSEEIAANYSTSEVNNAVQPTASSTKRRHDSSHHSDVNTTSESVPFNNNARKRPYSRSNRGGLRDIIIHGYRFIDVSARLQYERSKSVKHLPKKRQPAKVYGMLSNTII